MAAKVSTTNGGDDFGLNSAMDPLTPGYPKLREDLSSAPHASVEDVEEKPVIQQQIGGAGLDKSPNGSAQSKDSSKDTSSPEKEASTPKGNKLSDAPSSPVDDTLIGDVKDDQRDFSHEVDFPLMNNKQENIGFEKHANTETVDASDFTKNGQGGAVGGDRMTFDYGNSGVKPKLPSPPIPRRQDWSRGNPNLQREHQLSTALYN